jgi:hypothetical protein
MRRIQFHYFLLCSFLFVFCLATPHQYQQQEQLQQEEQSIDDEIASLDELIRLQVSQVKPRVSPLVIHSALSK